MMTGFPHQHLLCKEEDFAKEEGQVETKQVGKKLWEVHLMDLPCLCMLALLVKVKAGGAEKKKNAWHRK